MHAPQNTRQHLSLIAAFTADERRTNDHYPYRPHLGRLMGVLVLVDRCIGIVKLDEALAEDPEVADGVMRLAEEARAFWIDYWESFDHPHSREHALRSGYVEKPGDYAKGIKIKFMKDRSGQPMARITSHDFKSHWIEYGSRHMPAFAPRAATVSYFGGGSSKSIS